jgi:protein phosphatase
MTEGAEVRPLVPQAGDRLVLASDGLTNHVSHEDLVAGVARGQSPQELASSLIQLALDRGSRDNVTCVVVAFDAE